MFVQWTIWNVPSFYLLANKKNQLYLLRKHQQSAEDKDGTKSLSY